MIFIQRTYWIINEYIFQIIKLICRAVFRFRIIQYFDYLFQQAVKHAPHKTAFFASRYFDIINLLFVAAFYRKGNLFIIFTETWSQFIIGIVLEISYNITVLSFIFKHPVSKGIIIQYFYASIPVLRFFFLMLGRHQLFECARQPRLSHTVKGIDKLNLLWAVF